MPKKRKKKADLKDLDINEVSLVDTAANDEDFLIVKAADEDVDDVEDTPVETDTAEVTSPFAEPMNALGDAYDASVEMIKGKAEIDDDSKAAIQDFVLKGSANLKQLAQIAGIEHEDTLDPLSKASDALTDDTLPTPPIDPAPANEEVTKSSDDRLAAVENALVTLPDAIAKAFQGFGVQVTEQIKTQVAAQVATQVDAKTEAVVAPLRKSVRRLRNQEATSATMAVDDDTRSGVGEVSWPSDMAPKLA